MAYYLVIGPDYATNYVVNAASPTAAKQRVATLKRGSISETDFNAWMNDIGMNSSISVVSDADVASWKASYPDQVIDANTQGAGGSGSGDPGDGYGETGDNRTEAIRKIEQVSPYAGYLAGAKERYGDITGGGAYNRYLRSQGTGAQATFMGREALGQNPTDPNDPDRESVFQNYIKGNLSGNKGFSGEANSAFRDIRAGGGSTAAPDAISGYINPADLGSAQAGFNLARQARRGRFSSMLDRFMPDDFDLYNAWLGETGGTGTPPSNNNWLDYLQKRLGVTR